jgi:hypothetical protein
MPARRGTVAALAPNGRPNRPLSARRACDQGSRRNLGTAKDSHEDKWNTTVDIDAGRLVKLIIEDPRHWDCARLRTVACGTVTEYPGRSAVHGQSNNEPALHPGHSKGMGRHKADLTNGVFGRLTVIGDTGQRRARRPV